MFVVTAIVIPILFAYFYYLTKKERRKYYEKWMKIRNVKEEALVKGTVIDVQERKERYYHHYFIHVTDVVLNDSHKKIIARTQLPATDIVEKPIFQKGKTIISYGQWRDGIFFSRSF
ncbi:MAG TPA: hypothetical protein VEY68_12215 [Anoxybacillus sp.]|nr:hypothetical protein [Anoxybacillus sp.]